MGARDDWDAQEARSWSDDGYGTPKSQKMDAADAWLASAEGAGRASARVAEEAERARQDAWIEQSRAYYENTAAQTVQFGLEEAAGRWGLTLASDINGLKAQAESFRNNSTVFDAMLVAVNHQMKLHIVEAAKTAAERVNSDRKRTGWSARYNYPDRHGQKHLEAAIIKSAQTVQDGDYVLGYFDTAILDSETLVKGEGTRGGHGYWRSYEFGAHFRMPYGFWVREGQNEQDGQRTTTPTGTAKRGSRAGFTSRLAAARAMRGNDRFYAVTKAKGNYSQFATRDVYATQAAHPVMQEALEQESTRMLNDVRVQLGDLLEEASKSYHSERGFSGYSTGDMHGSVTTLGGTTGDESFYKGQ